MLTYAWRIHRELITALRITDTYFFRQILYYDFDKNGFIGSKFHVVILFEMS